MRWQPLICGSCSRSDCQIAASSYADGMNNQLAVIYDDLLRPVGFVPPLLVSHFAFAWCAGAKWRKCQVNWANPSRQCHTCQRSTTVCCAVPRLSLRHSSGTRRVRVRARDSPASLSVRMQHVVLDHSLLGSVCRALFHISRRLRRSIVRRVRRGRSLQRRLPKVQGRRVHCLLCLILCDRVLVSLTFLRKSWRQGGRWQRGQRVQGWRQQGWRQQACALLVLRLRRRRILQLACCMSSLSCCPHPSYQRSAASFPL